MNPHQDRFNIIRSWNRKADKGYEKWFWKIDIHDTIFKGNYKVGSEGEDIFPNAEKVLRYLSSRKDIVLILDSSSIDLTILKAMDRLSQLGVLIDYFNQNPEVEPDKFCSYYPKYYFDVGLDDKYGFNANTDWFEVEKVLESLFGSLDNPKSPSNI